VSRGYGVGGGAWWEFGGLGVFCERVGGGCGRWSGLGFLVGLCRVGQLVLFVVRDLWGFHVGVFVGVVGGGVCRSVRGWDVVVFGEGRRVVGGLCRQIWLLVWAMEVL